MQKPLQALWRAQRFVQGLLEKLSEEDARRRAIVALDQAVTASKAHRDRGSDDDLDEPPCTRVKIRACQGGMPPPRSRRVPEKQSRSLAGGA